MSCFVLAFGTALGLLYFSPMLTKNVMFVALIPFAALYVLVMFLDAKWMMLLLLYTRSLLDPILNMTKFGSEGGGGAGMGAVLNLLVIALVVILLCRFPGQITGHRVFIRTWLFFLGFCFLSVLLSPDRIKSFKLWTNLLTYLCIVLIPFMIVKKPEDKKFWIKTLLYSSYLPVALAYVGVVTKHPFFYAFERLKGTFTHSNILAFYLALVIAVVFYILKTKQFGLSFEKRALLWIYQLLLLVLLIITQTRSAWISCAGLFVIYSVFKERKYLFILMIIGPLIFLIPQVQSRLSDLSEGTGTRTYEKLNSMAWRLKLWESSLDSIKRRPVSGYGLGTFEQMSVDFFSLEKKTGAPAHNSYLELLFETGVIGLLSYLAIYWAILKELFSKMKSKVRLLSVEATVVFAYTIGYILVGLSDNTLYYLAFNWYFWFFIGLILQSFLLSDREKEGNAESKALRTAKKA